MQKEIATILDIEKDWSKYPSVGDGFSGCPFCGEIGFFPTGNGGINHTSECAITLAHRLGNTSDVQGNAFDQLAYRSLQYQLQQYEEKRTFEHSMKVVSQTSD